MDKLKSFNFPYSVGIANFEFKRNPLTDILMVHFPKSFSQSLGNHYCNPFTNNTSTYLHNLKQITEIELLK